MGINGVAGSLGVAIGPALGLFMVTHYSWRATYAVIAMLSLIALLFALLMRVFGGPLLPAIDEWQWMMASIAVLTPTAADDESTTGRRLLRTRHAATPQVRTLLAPDGAPPALPEGVIVPDEEEDVVVVGSREGIGIPGHVGPGQDLPLPGLHRRAARRRDGWRAAALR